MADILFGSLCLSDIPKELIKDVTCKDGKVRKYINISVLERKEVSQYGHTHFVSCSPKREEQRDGVNYIIGDLKRFVPQNISPTPEEINDAPIASSDDLPF